MLQINIPGAGMLEIQSLVLDFNGTIATDGKLINGVKDRLMRICENLQLFVITADTNGTVQKKECSDLPVTVHIIGQHQQAEEKAQFIENLPGARRRSATEETMKRCSRKPHSLSPSLEMKDAIPKRFKTATLLPNISTMRWICS